jgi:hypothetical protein
MRSIKTEDTGKKFEKAICNALSIAYVGPYKYAEPEQEFVDRLLPLSEICNNFTHTAEKGNRYDFSNSTEHLSAKSTKKGIGKVAPQVIGQCKPEKFCDIMKTAAMSVPDLKKYIQENIGSILPVLTSYTFDSPILYYNEEKNSIRYITLSKEIDWLIYQYKWTCEWDKWNNSSTLKVVSEKNEKGIAIVEFQFHTKSRTNMAIRFCFENFLSLFKENLTIVDL